MAIKDFEMNIKNADGSYDILHPITKAKNVLGLVEKVIVESGENSNGRYRMFADGTMDCTREIQYDLSDSSFKSYPLPKNFIDDYNVCSISIGAGLNNSREIWVARTAIARCRSSEWQVRDYATTEGGAEPISGTFRMLLFATGRWK